MRVRRKRARRRAPLWAHLLDDGATLSLTLTLTCSTTDPTPKTRTLISSWYTTSQACGPAGTSQQRPLTQMRSFITWLGLGLGLGLGSGFGLGLDAVLHHRGLRDEGARMLLVEPVAVPAR